MGIDDVLFAEKCILLMSKKLTIFPSFYWLSDDIVRFKIEVGF